MSLYILTTS